MVIRNLFSCALFAFAALLLAGVSARAVVPADTLMSASTRGFVSIADIEELNQHWQQTQLGQLVQDESMRPFVDDLKRQLQRKFASVREKLGLELGSLQNIAGGEIGLGFVERPNERAALVVTVDISGRRTETDEMLKRVDQELSKRGATKKTSEVAGTMLTTYTLPPQKKGDAKRTALYFVKDNMLCASDSVLEAQEILSRFSSESGGRLTDAKPYRKIMERCFGEAGRLQPELRWFVDPFGYARASRSLARPDAKRPGKDFLKILSSQGFDAIQGIGGFVNLSVEGSFEVLHRTMVYAPHQTDQEQYQLAMRMMNFPNSADLTPQAWVPRTLATYRTFNCDLANAYEHFGTLFDAFIGHEEAFETAMEAFEVDAYGPQISVRKDFIQHLGQRVTLVTDYKLPITPKCERFMFIVEVTDEKALAKTIEKVMNSDPSAFRREIHGKELWEIQEASKEIDDLEIASDLESLIEEIEQPEKDEDQAEGALASSAVCVANGHLYIASHLNFLKDMLDPALQGNSLKKSSDYREVELALSKLISGNVSAKCFLRTDEAYRPTYELLRQGKMPESETLLGRLLNRLLVSGEDDEEGILREQKIDGRKLPEFEMVRRYFGPAGTIIRSDKTGWFIAGAMLSKRVPQARARGAVTADNRTIR